MPSGGADRHAAPGADVVVVGAGPVGLLLATELALGGAAVTVLERLDRPTGESRATHLTARSMELLDQRGLLGPLGPVRADRVGHFAGIPVDLSRAPSHRPGLWRVPQPLLERVLADRAAELGVEIRWGQELRTLTVTRAEVRAGTADLSLRARYLVGCDGEDSTVRQAAGFELSGAAATRVLYRADVTGVTLSERRLRPYPAGLASVASRGDGVFRLMVHEFAGPCVRGPRRPAFTTVAGAWRRVTGEDLGAARPLWLDAFDDAARLVTRYRRGRVLLAGDAAHVQMPVGGQAINLGLQDAANLGWKLAAQVRGHAAAGLLDTYHDERHPAAARTLRDVTAQAALLFGGEATEPVRTVLRELIALPPVAAHFAARLSNLDDRFDPAPQIRGTS